MRLTPAISASGAVRGAQATLSVTLNNTGPRPFAVSRSDFALSAQADIFGLRGWDAGAVSVAIRPGHSRAFRLTFSLPSAALRHATLDYLRAGSAGSGMIPLDGSAAFTSPGTAPSTGSPTASISRKPTTPPTINAFDVSQGVGEPWGTAIDRAGDVWFAEPGCDFAPTCAANTPPGQIGEIAASSHAVVFYTLPSIAGNQPIFLTFDNAGNLWFTTPDNSSIGEFNPSTRTFIGQWPVTAGSGPWDLAFANGEIWYTEHLGSAVGDFSVSSHLHRDFQTPSANSNLYGIAINGQQIWFTENNSSVDRVAALDARNNTIAEYPIVLPLSNSTPHMITIGAGGQPWWTEGWSNTIATLKPATAQPGQCGTTSGTCAGIERFTLPPPTACSASPAHTSGIAFQQSGNLVWLDNSLTAQVGSFQESRGAFALSTLSNCGAHPHDGLSLDLAGNAWFDEEFASVIGELIP
jgi:streptogramin lyase